MNVEKLMDGLDKIYGPGRGAGVYMTIIPGILADFHKMLKKTSIGQEISEKYQLEDRKAVILLRGSGKAKDDFDINAEVIEEKGSRL